MRWCAGKRMDNNKKTLTKIDELLYLLQNNRDDGFYGKIIETYEAGEKVHTKIEITVKEKKAD